MSWSREIMSLKYNDPTFFIDEESNNCQIIDFAVLYDTKVYSKENEKVEIYKDRSWYISKQLKLWKMIHEVIPGVMSVFMM